MIKQIITKEKVIVDPINQVEDYVILTLKSVDYHGNVFHASSEYQAQSGGVLKEVSASFTKEEADQLFSLLGIEFGSFSSMCDDFMGKVMLKTVDDLHLYGLTGADWEDYIVEETVEEVVL